MSAPDPTLRLKAADALMSHTKKKVSFSNCDYLLVFMYVRTRNQC